MFSKLPIVDLLRRTSSISIYENELSKTQFLTREKIQQLQWSRFKKLITHAYNNVPYYKRIFTSHGITPDDIKSPEYLIRIPILTKKIIRENYKDLIAENPVQYNPRILTSGGSTGEPLRFFIDKNTNGYQWADVIRGQKLAGWDYGDRIGRFWGSSVLSIQKPFQKKVYAWLNDWRLFSAFDASNENMKKWIEVIRKEKISFLSGYVDSIVDFARFSISQNLQTQLTAVFPTTAPISISGRRIIEKAFGCGIFDLYQSADGGLSAIECHQHNGLHLSEERCLVESTPAKGEKDIPVIVTDLFNYAMPFIRYENGDEITITDEYCKCGRESTIIKSVLGKTYHHILLPNGNKVHSEIFSYYLNNFLIVKHFLARQVSSTKIELDIEIDSHYESERKLLENSLRKIPSSIPGIDFEYNFVEKIEKMPNQKYSLFIPLANNGTHDDV
jgi:phenylacetate-CoA ligase